MSPSKLGLFASLALAANAVLIPPSVAIANLGDDKALETLAINPFKRSVAVECPRCAVATLDGDSLNWEKDTGNAFLLDFEVGSREDSLEVDGVQLYPPTFAMASQPFYITQINPKGEDNLRLRVTGYTFHFNSAETVSEAGVELLPMTFRITSVESKPMDPLPITINLLKEPSGRLMIASFGQTAIEAAPAGKKECKQWSVLCKWKGIMADRMGGLKHMGKGRPGCHNRPKGHHNPMVEETFRGKPPHRFRPGGHHRPPHHMEHNGPHHPPHHHGHHHRMHMFLRRAFFTILVPVLIGIFAGTLTYLIGMALGCLIAITIARIRGQSYQPIALEDDVEEAAADERSEKHEYAELPAYDVPPVYEDTPEKKLQDETK
ncbi:hypothetical protein E8E13_010955 [Curvularia kusanoi]|uniref:DUF7728 domain-containing protein n=1 Tax=Curvularia kusanoi TaxID=90978 RepID=A0A9P4WEY8_CURKU|nr:hypothetical protein E8E13_010955 [Curvularia kusanoi]